MILHEESDAGELLNIFARSIKEWSKEEETTSKVDEDNDDNSIVTIEAEDTKLANPVKAKQVAAEMLTTITDVCDNVLALLQAVSVKSP